MSKTKHITFLLFFAVAITLFFACKKTPDRPPINPLGDKITIKGLRDLFTTNNAVNYKFTKDISLYATVAMTDNYKTLYLKDETGSITLKQLNAHGIFEGDSLRINLNGSWLDLTGSQGSIQIDSVDVSSSITNKVVKLDVGKTLVRPVVSIAQLNKSVSNTVYTSGTFTTTVPNSVYDGQVVQINGVQFGLIDSTNYYIPPNSPNLFINHTLYDCGSINSIVLSLYKGTTDFLNQKIPAKNSGSIIAAVTFYNGALQLTPRSFNDLVLNQPRCGVDTMTQSFESWTSAVTSSNYATYTPGWFDQAQVGFIYWVGGSSTSPGFASASNTYAPANTRNVMWLISPPVQNSPSKNLSFQTSYSNPSTAHPNQLSVLISTDFNGNNLKGTHAAHWTDITSYFPLIQNGSTGTPNWPANASAAPVMFNQFSLLNSYTGTFYIGFRYIGNTVTPDSTQTINVLNVSIKD